MSSYRFFEVEISTLSPTILVFRATRTGYLKPLDYIPGPTLRGAILTALHYHGYLTLKDLEKEAKNPSFLSTPAFPVVSIESREFRAVPATPFDFECKLCRRRESKLRDLVGVYKKGLSQLVSLTAECPEHGPMRTLYSILLAHRGRKPILDTIYVTSVAINKATRTAMRGLLYNYEALVAGLKFWARLTIPDYIAGKIPSIFEVSIGRGRSRGFGRAQIKLLEEHNPENTQPSGFFIALSPLLPLRTLTWGSCSITAEAVYGRTFKVVSGWDMVMGFHKPIVTAVRRGAVLVARVQCADQSSLQTFITMLSHGGLPVEYSGVWLTGFNTLLTLDEYLSIRGDISA